MKKIFLPLLLLITVNLFAEEGIEFSHVSWKEAKAKAIKEKKLIFIDFYTQWCGPCLMMQKEVFIQNDVAGFFNTTFINLKVDAEHGEGIELAKKYKVHVYPTYTFIDPSTENMVHESSGRQDKETFLATAKNASDPAKSSTYLLAQYQAGNNTPDFLISYASYQASKYNREEVLKTAEKLATMPGYTLENEKVWLLFVNNISGRNNNLFKDFIAQKDRYTVLYGKEAVDKKLFSLYSYSPDPSTLAEAPEFAGKEFLIKKNNADRLIRAKKYDEASPIIKEMMANPGEYKKEICEYLFSTSRYAFLSKVSAMEEYPESWKKDCLSYIQYSAYNMPERDNQQLTFTYASALEKVLKSIPEASKYLPEDFASPMNGVKEYSNRDPQLKQKPVKKK